MPFTIPNEPASPTAQQTSQASLFQADIDALVAGFVRTGVVSGCAVTAQGTPDMTVAVAIGVIEASGVAASVSAGNVTIATADGTNPRIDLIVASSAGVKSAVAGTPDAQPDVPALPASSVALAAVYVPANDTAIGSAQITDKRVMLGGIFGSAVVVGGDLTVDGDTFEVVAADDKIGHSVGGEDPWQPPNLIGPLTVKFGSRGLYADSGTGNIYHSSFFAENTGTRPTVGILGGGKASGAGAKAWGMNPYAYTNHTDPATTTISLEVNYGCLVAGGKSFGIVIVPYGGAAGSQAHIQMQAGAAGSEPVNGIVFAKSGALQPVSASLIAVAGGPSVPYGINFNGATFTTAAIRLPNNAMLGQEDSGTTLRNLITLDSSNLVAIGDTAGVAGVIFRPGAAERARLTSTGLGIGITPLVSLHVADNNSTGVIPFAAENLATDNTTSKTTIMEFAGRDTVNARKPAVRLLARPFDSNLVGAQFEIQTRNANVLASVAYFTKEGNAGIGADPGTAARLLVSQGTIATGIKGIDLSATWNAAGVAFTGLRVNVTSTASAAASLLADMLVGAVSQWKVDKAGNVTQAGTLNGHAIPTDTGAFLTAGSSFAGTAKWGLS